DEEMATMSLPTRPFDPASPTSSFSQYEDSEQASRDDEEMATMILPTRPFAVPNPYAQRTRTSNLTQFVRTSNLTQFVRNVVLRRSPHGLRRFRVVEWKPTELLHCNDVEHSWHNVGWPAAAILLRHRRPRPSHRERLGVQSQQSMQRTVDRITALDNENTLLKTYPWQLGHDYGKGQRPAAPPRKPKPNATKHGKLNHLAMANIGRRCAKDVSEVSLAVTYLTILSSKNVMYSRPESFAVHDSGIRRGRRSLDHRRFWPQSWTSLNAAYYAARGTPPGKERQRSARGDITGFGNRRFSKGYLRPTKSQVNYKYVQMDVGTLTECLSPNIHRSMAVASHGQWEWGMDFWGVGVGNSLLAAQSSRGCAAGLVDVLLSAATVEGAWRWAGGAGSGARLARGAQMGEGGTSGRCSGARGSAGEARRGSAKEGLAKIRLWH
ncbi:hypothetical protein THAOC_10748, partial [Thalassiosira oceanica]